MIKSNARKRTSAASKRADFKGKAPKNGVSKAFPEANSSDKIGFAVVSVKLRPAEKIEFQALCKGLEISPNWGMRSLVRQASGYLEVDKTSLEELQSISRQLTGVATNINQIAKAGNRTFSPDYVAFMEDRGELGRELGRLQSQLQTLLDVGRRRTDGLAMLETIVNPS